MPLTPTGNDSGAPQVWHGVWPPAMSSLRPQDSQTTALAAGRVASSPPHPPQLRLTASVTVTLSRVADHRVQEVLVSSGAW